MLTVDGIPPHVMHCYIYAVDFEAVREEGQVPILWSELWSAHHRSQGSRQQGLTTPTPTT